MTTSRQCWSMVVMAAALIMAGTACAGSGPTVAGPNPQSGNAGPLVTSAVLGQGSAAEKFAITTENTSDVIVQQVIIRPGGRTGWHTHPGTVLAVVKAGTLTRYTADCTAVNYPTGQAFVETQGVHEGRNEGTVPVELYVTYIDPAGSPLKTDATAPACAR